MTEKNYLEPSKSALGRSISHYSWLRVCVCVCVGVFPSTVKASPD